MVKNLPWSSYNPEGLYNRELIPAFLDWHAEMVAQPMHRFRRSRPPGDGFTADAYMRQYGPHNIRGDIYRERNFRMMVLAPLVGIVAQKWSTCGAAAEAHVLQLKAELLDHLRDSGRFNKPAGLLTTLHGIISEMLWGRDVPWQRFTGDKDDNGFQDSGTRVVKSSNMHLLFADAHPEGDWRRHCPGFTLANSDIDFKDRTGESQRYITWL